MRIRIIITALCVSLLPLGMALSQEPGVQWTTDLEAAKAEASKSGKLVLVHFWTPDCKPCAVLDRDVFSQQSVAGIVQQSYIPVKIDASPNADRAVADAYGVTVVPFDVVLSPLGQVIHKSKCPNSPTAYMAHVAKIATTHRHGQATPFEQSAAQTETPQVPNPAYAQLNIANGTTAAAPTPSVPASPAASTVSNPYAASSTPSAQQPVTETQPAVAAATPQMPPAAAPMNDNRYAMSGSVTSSPGMNPYASGMTAQAPATTAQPQVQQNPMAAAQATPPAAQVVTNPTYTRGAATAAPTQPTSQPSASITAVAPQLPPGSPPLGFDGFCPVSMKRQVMQLPEQQWTMVRGDTRFGLEHRGRVYLFASEECRREFLANPDAYSPALSGLDPVVFLEQNQSVPGTSKHGLEYRGQFYLFSNEQTMNRFRQRADLYVTGVQQAMQGAPGRMVR